MNTINTVIKENNMIDYLNKNTKENQDYKEFNLIQCVLCKNIIDIGINNTEEQNNLNNFNYNNNKNNFMMNSELLEFNNYIYKINPDFVNIDKNNQKINKHLINYHNFHFINELINDPNNQFMSNLIKNLFQINFKLIYPNIFFECQICNIIMVNYEVVIDYHNCFHNSDKKMYSKNFTNNNSFIKESDFENFNNNNKNNNFHNNNFSKNETNNVNEININYNDSLDFDVENNNNLPLKENLKEIPFNNINYNINKNETEIKYIYCLLCNSFHFLEENNEFHYHFSFLNENESNSNPLYSNFIMKLNNLEESKMSSLNKNNNQFGNLFYPQNDFNNFKSNNNINSFNNQPFGSFYPNKKAINPFLIKDNNNTDYLEEEDDSNYNSKYPSINPSPQTKKNFKFNKIKNYKKNSEEDQDIGNIIKEWELYSSSSRYISDDINKNFNETFKEKMFGYCNLLNTNTHIFSNNKKEISSQLFKRLANEFKSLKDNLPCDFNSSYFIRADENYPNYIKVLIAGSRGTPYEHGLFEYDIWLPLNYPNEAPKCNLVTTGNGTIRFNPNLYTNGYVCLSLLGTWAGNSVEKWDPKNSNLTRLLLSLSSLVMNNSIVSNEPGHEGLMKNIEGVKENEAYSNIVKLGNIEFAMIKMLTSPPKAFEEIIKEYFKMKGQEILKDLDIWINRIDNIEYTFKGIAQVHNMQWGGKLKDKETLKNNLKIKYDALSKLI